MALKIHCIKMKEGKSISSTVKKRPKRTGYFFPLHFAPSLRSKRFRGVSEQNSPKNGTFEVLAAQKMWQEQKMREGEGERKERNACRPTPGF